MEALVFLLLVALALTLVIVVPRYRRKRLLARPFPRQWQLILEQNLGVYASFPAPLKRQLQHLIVLFMHEKKFYACGGLVIDDEIRVTIAAEACLLLLNRATSGYNSLQAILVYPSAYRATREQHDSSGVTHTDTHTMLGESWSNGRLILSWDDVQRGVNNFEDGQNVVLHEFAHQLDQESGSANGAPVLASGSSYQSWARVLSREFEQLQRRTESGSPSLIDRYGAQNPGEFFAVATETFFERPAQLCQLHPQLFDELRRYYCVDPRQWHQ